MTTDRYVEALKALIDRLPGGRVELAAAIRANEQSLYQIVSGVPLASGRARTVGRDLRERLDRHFPGWDQGSSNEPLRVSEPEPPYNTSSQVTVAEFVRALSQAPKVRWPAVAALLEQAAGRPEMVDDVISEVTRLLGPDSSKRTGTE